jgi:hypothetical protein
MSDYVRETNKYLRLFYLGLSLTYLLLTGLFSIFPLSNALFLSFIAALINIIGFFSLESKVRNYFVWYLQLIVMIFGIPLSFPFIIRWLSYETKKYYMEADDPQLLSFYEGLDLSEE